MANQWFRLYAEFANDPKIQMMSESNQRRYVMLLCIRCNGDVTLQDEEVAFQLRISNEEWATTKALFVSKELITEDNKPAAWDRRQFASDSSAARVSRHRAKKKEQCNVTVTPQIQNRTDTDISTDVDIKPKREKSPRFDAQAHLVSIGVDAAVAADWIQSRNALKAKPTLTAINAISSEAERSGTRLSDVLAICCQRGWRGFKAEWISDDQKRNGSRRATVSDERAYTSAVLTGKVPSGTTLDQFMAGKNQPIAIEGRSVRVA